jgi:tol-pal system protein YbgF
MTCIASRFAIMPAIGAAMLLAASAASAQQTGPFAFLDRLFGDSERVSPGAPPQQGNPQAAPQPPAAADDGRVAQAPPGELMMRINRLEAQIRQMTGVIEQLQHRNRQLESQLRSAMGAAPGGAPPASAAPPQHPPHAAATPVPAPQVAAQPPQVAAPAPRGDVFDPTQHPNAPGAPRALGSIHSGSSGPAPLPHDPNDPVGAPGGRDAGAPLDLSTLAAGIATSPPPSPPTGGMVPQVAAPPRNPGGAGTQVATLPPSDSPKDNFDLAYGYILRKDYALAEGRFRDFLQRFPGDRLASDAHYWLGESMFQRQRFRDAAESFLNVSTKYETAAKAPDALLRLGQSLAALGEKEAACASFAEVLRKYPRASVAIRQGVNREQKRVRC